MSMDLERVRAVRREKRKGKRRESIISRRIQRKSQVMDPFVHLPVFKVVVCTVCQYAMLPSQISYHLSGSNSYNIIKEVRERISEEVNRIKGWILCRVELDKLPIPISLT
jgi:hypothetical protein